MAVVRSIPIQERSTIDLVVPGDGTYSAISMSESGYIAILAKTERFSISVYKKSENTWVFDGFVGDDWGGLNEKKIQLKFEGDELYVANLNTKLLNTFKRENGQWVVKCNLELDFVVGGYFDFDTSGNILLVGDNSNELDSGIINLYSRNGDTWALVESITADDDDAIAGYRSIFTLHKQDLYVISYEAHITYIVRFGFSNTGLEFKTMTIVDIDIEIDIIKSCGDSIFFVNNSNVMVYNPDDENMSLMMNVQANNGFTRGAIESLECTDSNVILSYYEFDYRSFSYVLLYDFSSGVMERIFSFKAPLTGDEGDVYETFDVELNKEVFRDKSVVINENSFAFQSFNVYNHDTGGFSVKSRVYNLPMEPTTAPTLNPTLGPTKRPTLQPTKSPSHKPTKSPTKEPTRLPTKSPTTPTTTNPPTRIPTKSPTREETDSPTSSPTRRQVITVKKETISDSLVIIVGGVVGFLFISAFGWKYFVSRTYSQVGESF